MATELSNGHAAVLAHGDAVRAVQTLLAYLGENVERDGLRDTPDRVVKALCELTKGYDDDPAAILATTFDVAYDEMVTIGPYPFASLCEHHLLPFTGTAVLGYVPGDRVVGLSKLGRLIDCYARRLQVQERMTVQLADAMVQHLEPRGVGVVVRAVHQCMANRGVGKSAPMHTVALRGVLFDKPEARAEFLALAHAPSPPL